MVTGRTVERPVGGRSSRLRGVRIVTREVVAKLVHLEGRRVSVAFTDGSRLDDCELVSTGHHGASTLWLYSNGADVFAPPDEVIDIWEAAAP
jgi:hypothetical protein